MFAFFFLINWLKTVASVQIRNVYSAIPQLHHAWLPSGGSCSIFSESTCFMYPFLSCSDDPHFWIPTGRAAWLNEAHSSLPLHCVARSWCARDHPVPDSVCQNCKRLYQQDTRHRTKYCTLQVCAAAKGQWHRALVPILGRIPNLHPCYTVGSHRIWEIADDLQFPNTLEWYTQGTCIHLQTPPGEASKIILREPLYLCGTTGEHKSVSSCHCS